MNEQGTYGGVSQATGTTAGGAAGVVKDEVQRLASEARTGTARVASQAKDQAGELVNRTKDQTAQRLSSLASALRQAGVQLEGEDAAGFGRYAGLAADQVEKASGYLSGKDLGELVRDTQTFARRHPDLFLGGAFLAGVMVARFIKSSAPQVEARGGAYGEGFGQGAYGQGAYGQSGFGETGYSRPVYDEQPTEPFNTPHFSGPDAGATGGMTGGTSTGSTGTPGTTGTIGTTGTTGSTTGGSGSGNTGGF